MKKIKIRAVFGSWQGYQELANYPPQEIEYAGVSKDTVEGRYYEKKKLKEFASSVIQKLNLPRMMVLPPGDYDLIHISRGIIPLNRKPWVMDIEHVHSFFGLNPKFLRKKHWKRFMEKILSSKNCKAILCHCEATRQSFHHYLDCRKFEKKLQILYPSSHIIPLKKEKHKKIRILCVLSLFERKAGVQVLKAFSELEKKYKNIELWLKADVPENLKKKYNSKNIKYIGYFSDILPRERLLRDIYSKCDIFLYPSLCDSFGYSLIDALVAGLPIITTNLFAFPDIVENNKNGYIIKIPGYKIKKEWKQDYPLENFNREEEREFIKEIIKKLGELIKNRKTRKKMGEESFKLVSEGKFSIKRRNKQLREIYEEAIIG